MQEELFNFENEIASYLSVKHAIGVGDGTMAILCSLIASGIGKGDEVIVPAHTFVSSVAAIYHLGAKPILVDCGKDHLIVCGQGIDPGVGLLDQVLGGKASLTHVVVGPLHVGGLAGATAGAKIHS